jgi:large subunit ribosomal protein L23
MVMEYTQVLLRPLISEKCTFLKEKVNQVAFYVRKDANKIEIRKAVEEAFGVKVEAVNVVNKKPQAKTFSRGRKRLAGRVPGYKKAYVTLARGSKIEFFEGV